MAISGQQNINIGLPNNPTDSDSLYTAFNTVQNNFENIFSNASPITAITAGNGIAISNSTSSYQITNSGVTKLVAGTNVIITNSLGNPGNVGDLIISATGGGGGGGGTVTSVGVSSSSLTVTNSPVITAGSITLEIPTQSISAGSYTNPSVTVSNKGIITAISSGASSGTVTSVGLTAGDGIQIAGGPITSSGSISVTNTGVTSIVAGTGISINQSTGAVTISSSGGGGGGGTVTRVGVTSSTMTVTGSPVVSSGNINIELPSSISVTDLTATIANLTTVNASQLNASSPNNSSSPIVSYNATATSGTLTLTTVRTRGTLLAPASILSTDELLKFRSVGYTSFSQYQAAGFITIKSNGVATGGSSYIPSDVVLNSTTASLIKSFTFTSTGNLVIPGTFVGDGSGLSSLAGANVTGTVANATYAVTSGTASSVAGANVTGTVANATYAVTSGTADSVAGANVSGTVANSTYADTSGTADSVAGANVSGTVANSTYAVTSGTADSVAGANVTGTVANSTYAVTSGTADSVAGANVSGTVANSTYAGALATTLTSTGTVYLPFISATATGNYPHLSNDSFYANLANGAIIATTFVGSLSGEATTAGTVTSAAQANITSVGTLTSLEVTNTANIGNLRINETSTANTTATVTRLLPINVGGTMYNIMLTD